MAYADRGYLGGVILRWLALGGIVLWMKYHGFSGGKQTRKGKKKPALPQVYNAKEDYFSQLPDDVLSSILARLTVKDATRTSILSRRWRYIFASMPTLRFSHDMLGSDPYRHTCCPDYRRKFLNVVNQFLRFYSGRKVTHLEMDVCIGREFSKEFDQLMHSISRLGVEILRLRFDCGTVPITYDYNPNPNKLFRFPLKLLSQASKLEYLLLYLCIVQPSCGVRLNSLKTLNLMGVLLERGQLEGILSSCVNLNLLRLASCRLPHKLCISGTVTSVHFIECGGLEEIDLQATNLRRFDCYFFSNKVRFYFSFVPMLEFVKIELSGDASMAYIFGDFARDLPAQVKSLTVTAIHSQVKYFPTEMQVLRNLRKLTLILEYTYDFDIVQISPLLSACPLLQYLCLVHGGAIRQVTERGIRSPLSPTNHTELKEVTFRGFHGTGREIEFAIYILRSAMVLQRMFLRLHYRCDCDGAMWEKISERERKSIQLELLGQAISRNAAVIIK